jgi:hypothetical protein
MSASKGNSRTPGKGSTAEADLRGFIATHAPEHARLIAEVRRSLRRRLPTAHELVYEYRDFIVISFSPNERGYDGALAIRANNEGVRLCLSGAAELPDPERRLQGSGKQVRWVALENTATLAEPVIARLIDDAIARNPIPFASTGQGSVVIQSVTTGKRRKD